MPEQFTVARCGALAALAVVAMTSIAACGAATPPTIASAPSGPKMTVQMDAPDYRGIRELQRLADAVVSGTFTNIVERTDEGSLIGQADRGVGLPMAIWRFRVDRSVWSGPTAETLYVQRIDTDRVRSELLDDLVAGATAVLFLREVGSFDGAELYAIVGLDQGRLVLDDEGSLKASVAPGLPLYDDVRRVGSVDTLAVELSTIH